MFEGRMPMIYAEAKPRSPHDLALKADWETQVRLAIRIGKKISVHVDPGWGGSLDLIRRTREMTDLPILAKGFHEKDQEIAASIEAGADEVLVVGRIPGIYQDRCLIEPNTLAELESVPPEFRVVWNARDLLNQGRPKLETFAAAREIHPGWMCQASFIRTVHDIKARANAILVGTHLLEFSLSFQEWKRSHPD